MYYPKRWFAWAMEKKVAGITRGNLIIKLNSVRRNAELLEA
jgi:hypothetical protein